MSLYWRQSRLKVWGQRVVWKKLFH